MMGHHGIIFANRPTLYWKWLTTLYELRNIIEMNDHACCVIMPFNGGGTKRITMTFRIAAFDSHAKSPIVVII